MLQVKPRVDTRSAPPADTKPTSKRATQPHVQAGMGSPLLFPARELQLMATEGRGPKLLEACEAAHGWGMLQIGCSKGSGGWGGFREAAALCSMGDATG